MPWLLVVAGDAFERAMQIDRAVVTGLANERDDALRLAERIGADQMRALGKQLRPNAAAGRSRPPDRHGGTPAGRRWPR